MAKLLARENAQKNIDCIKNIRMVIYNLIKIGGCMDLREYMFRNRLTSVQLAKDLECSRQLITIAKAGKRVSKRFAKDVSEFTKGLVTVEELMNPKLNDLKWGKIEE